MTVCGVQALFGELFPILLVTARQSLTKTHEIIIVRFRTSIACRYKYNLRIPYPEKLQLGDNCLVPWLQLIRLH